MISQVNPALLLPALLLTTLAHFVQRILAEIEHGSRMAHQEFQDQVRWLFLLYAVHLEEVAHCLRRWKMHLLKACQLSRTKLL